MTNYKQELNIFLENNKDISECEKNKLINFAYKINRENPFCHIKNYSISKSILKKSPIWISYGGTRTGSTFVYNVLKILQNSLDNNSIHSWEGEFSKVSNFYELISRSKNINCGILKIHRFDEEVVKKIKSQNSLAIVSIRDYPGKAISYWRMINNIQSPFFIKNAEIDILIPYIKEEILLERLKYKINECLFIREDLIKKNTKDSINKICNFLKIEIRDASLEHIVEATCLKSMLNKQLKVILNSFGHSNDSFLHSFHIDNGEINVDKEKIKDLVWKNFKEDLNEDGYLKN